MNQRWPAWRLICGALFEHGAVGRAELDALVRSPRLSWAHVVSFAGDYYVTPGVWLGLAAAGLDVALPADARQYLQAIHAMNLRRNAALVAQLDEAVEALNHAHVKPLLLKGAAYLKIRAYSDAGTRISADLDLLVPHESAETARHALEGIGYTPIPGRESEPTHHHLVPLARPGEAGAIELHVGAVSNFVKHVLPTAEAWRFSAEHDSRRFSVLSPTHAVLHRFLHDQIVDGHAAQRQISLRSLSDIVALNACYGRAIDWAAIRDRANGAGYGSQFKSYLFVAHRIAGLRPPVAMDFGAREAAHLLACRSVVRWNAARAGIAALERLSAARIKKRYGETQTFLSTNAHRVDLAVELLRGKLSRGDG